jgi:hypothetical protein
MQRKILNALRSVGAVAAGYVVIVIGTSLTLGVLLEGKSYAEASPWEHVVGAMGSILSGLLGGYVAAWLAGRKPVGHALAVVLILGVETTWIVITGVGSNPVWFDLAGGLTLMGTTVLGAWTCATRAGLRARPGAA